MKKAIAFVTSLMIIMSLSSCGSTASETANNDSEKTSDESISMDFVDEEEETEDETEDEEEKVSDSKKEKTNKTAVKSGFKESTIEETVLVDQDGIKVTATDLSFSKYSAKLNLKMENNSDKKVDLVCGSLGYCCNSINGVMVEDGYFNCSLDVNEQESAQVTFDCSKLNILGIDEIADIELGIYSSSSILDYTYYPVSKIETSLVEDYDYKKNNYIDNLRTSNNYEVLYESNEEVFNADDVRIISETLVKNDEGNHELIIEIDNDSEYQTVACVGNIAINGVMIADYGEIAYECDIINSGKKDLMSIQLENTLALDKNYWDEYGIDVLKNISYSFYLEDVESNHKTDSLKIMVPVITDKFEPDTTGDVINENNGVRIIFKGLENGKYGLGKSVLLLVENKSGKTKKVSIDSDSISVNGNSMSSFVLSKTVGDNEYRAITFNLSDNELKENNISKITDINEIEFGIKVVEEDDWSSQWDDNYDTVVIKPVK